MPAIRSTTSKRVRSAAQKAQVSGLAQIRLAKINSGSVSGNKENENLVASKRPKTRSKTRLSSFENEIALKKTEILQLRTQLSGAAANADRHKAESTKALDEQKALDKQISLLTTQLEDQQASIALVLRKLTGTRDLLTKSNKRVLRLARQRSSLKSALLDKVSSLQKDLEYQIEKANHASQELTVQITALEKDLAKTRSNLDRERLTSGNRAKRSRIWEKRAQRAQKRLTSSRTSLKQLRSWSPTKSGVYTLQARELTRKLMKCGCHGNKVKSAISACAQAFGIKVTRDVSRRTASRAKKEAGVYGLIQLGREIINAPAFGESTDGTTHRKITYEARHITLPVPSYAPDVDDSDQSTWTYKTRFAEVAPALDHTAQRQFEGSQELASKVASAYANSPLAARDGQTMEPDDWSRKQVMQNMDHAADGKKKFKLSKEYKKDVTRGDLGRDRMNSLSSAELVEALASISEDEIQNFAGGDIAMTPDEKRNIALKLLETKLGAAAFNDLSPAQQSLLDLFVFGGCCGHKDLNAFKYGVVEMNNSWTDSGRPPPVLLANKANDAVIRLGQEADTAAVQRAVDSSARGGVKLTSLAGALFRHKNDDTGYQDRHRHFMTVRKKELHDEQTSKRFPDTSNTRYQSHSYAAAELITYHELYIELMAEICDGKAKSGMNHLEGNVAKGLEDASTLAELAAMALYGVSVSWPYLREARGNGEELVNLLDLTDIHRKIPKFCEDIASNPDILLDPNSPLDRVTLDGKPFMDQRLLAAVRMLAPELPDLNKMISSMFSGAAKGWIQFTPEFAIGGPFDSLTAEERSLIFIPSTNDANEGGLGSWRVHVRYHPNSTASSFSSQARSERNNTENFIKKCCDENDQQYVMRLVRAEDSSGVNAHFRETLMLHQRQRAQDVRRRQEEDLKKKQKENERLMSVGLVTDRDVLAKMTAPNLKDQIHIHRKLLKDKILLSTPFKDMPNKGHKLYAVFASLTRNESLFLSESESEEIVPLDSDNMDIDTDDVAGPDSDEMDCD